MASRKPRATITNGSRVGSLVICEDGTVWELVEENDTLSWVEGPPIPDDAPGPPA